MRTLIFVVLVLLPCMAVASTNCHVVEYADHYEAICNGDKPASVAPAQAAGQQQAFAAQPGEHVSSGQTEDSQQPTDASPEQIVRNGLARAFGESVLRSNHGRF